MYAFKNFIPCIVKTQSQAFHPVQERFCILIFVKFLCIGTILIKLKFKTSKFINFDLSTAVANVFCFLSKVNRP